MDNEVNTVASPRLAYEPGIDGIRALSVVAVLLFHADFGWAKGGFLGVSVFFTVSGYLITSLLVAEWHATSTISLVRFYGRRLRRLAPASVLTIIAVLALAPWLTDGIQRARLPGDAIAAVAYVANWRFLWSGQSYSELFAAPSPLQHFWSLAIEEQFYIVYPLVFLAALRLLRTRRKMTWFLGIAFGGSVIVGMIADGSDRIYYGTDTRAAELLAGALLAVVASGRRPVPGRIALLLGTIALAAFTALCAVTPQSAGWLSNGGFPAFAAVSIGLIVGVTRSDHLRSLIGSTPLVAVGRVSYGLYLLHWPVYLWLDEDRVGLGGWALLAVRLGVTSALTVLSYWLVESPIRHRRRLIAPEVALGVFAVTATLACGLAVGRAAMDEDVVAANTEVALAEGAAPFDETGAVIFTTADPKPVPEVSIVPAPGESVADSIAPLPPPPPPPIRALVVGSSSAIFEATESSVQPPESAAEELVPTPSTTEVSTTIAASEPGDSVGAVPQDSSAEREIEIIDRVTEGCPIAPAVGIEGTDGTERDLGECLPAIGAWPEFVRQVEPDLIIVVLGELDRLPIRRADDPALPTTSVEYLERLRWSAEEIGAAVASVRAAGVPVLLVDAARKQDFLADKLVEIDLREEGASLVTTAVLDSAAGIRGAIGTALDQPDSPSGLRVMVAGDSTSIGFAEAMYRAGDGSIEVLSAGRDGCPIVDAVATRWSRDAEFDATGCPRIVDAWTGYLDEFDPDVIIIVTSLMEQSEHRYVADGDWHVAGEPEFVAAHDQAMEQMQELVSDSATPLIIADSPTIDAAVMKDSQMARPERIDAWNGQILRWAERWKTVRVLSYATPLLSLEATRGSVREDGVHVDPDTLVDLSRDSYLPQIVEILDRLRPELAAEGCLIGGSTARFDPAKCQRATSPSAVES